MNEAYWHLAINHIPIIFPVAGVIVAVTGMVSGSEALKRTAFLIFILGALAAIVSMSTGEGAEEVVEKMGGIPESYIEEHEESAEVFSTLSYILGGLSLLGLWASFRKRSFSNVLAIVTFVFSLVVLFFGSRTGTTGGEIRHTEIRGGNSGQAADIGEHEEED
jgi:uncharacterized membrane protein